MQFQNYFPQVTTQYSKVIRAPIFGDGSENIDRTEAFVNSNDLEVIILELQEKVCCFFLELVKKSLPELVLSEFNNLFINSLETFNSEPQEALLQIIVSNHQEAFTNVFKRSIYILLNNWIYTRKYKPAQDLVQIISNAPINSCLSSPIQKRLSGWLEHFVNSQDYQEIKLFVSKYDSREKEHWKSRYTSYLLAPQYLNNSNSIEQRLAAKALSKQLQNEFKFDLAMYTAHASTTAFNQTRSNPTALGDEALRLIKKIVAKRGFFSYANLANIFLQQTQQLKYKDFKQSLLKYLFFSVGNQGLANHLKIKLTERLETVYQNAHEEVLDKALLLKTCNRVIEFLTMKNQGEPSSLFIALASQGNPLTLAIILLKVILICSSARSHLEVCIANLIQYYESYSQEECHWVINFLEITKIILVIFSENVQYNLVNMEEENLEIQPSLEDNAFRIFSQQMEKNK